MSNWDFALAIDVGNSRVVAAVAPVTRGAQKEATVLAFGDDRRSAVSAVFVDSDGTLFFGGEAECLGVDRPERLVREFAHQIGDDVPIMIGEHAIRTEDLYARMCAWVVETAAASEGSPPAVVAITHPTSWGGHRCDLVTAALQRVGITDAILLSEAEAAARHYEASHPLETGDLLAMYDLGGTKFDALVLRKRAAEGVGSQPLGEQVSIDDLGGANFDELLFHHVRATAEMTAPLDDDAMMHALTQLQREVVKAKETLSSEADATVPVTFTANSATVRINRSEFEALIDESLEKTLDALDLAIESAGIEPNRLEAILLTGGSSRIPLVAQRLSERFNLPLIAERDPKATVALGAAFIALDRLEAGLSPSTALVAIEDARAVDSDATPTASRAGVLTVLRPEPGKSWWPKSPILLTTAAAFIAFAIVFSNTTAAGEAQWPDYVQVLSEEAATVVDPLMLEEPTSPPSAADQRANSDASPKAAERTSDRNISSNRNASRGGTLQRDHPSASLPHNRETSASAAHADTSAPRGSTPKSHTHTSGPKVEPSGPPVEEAPDKTGTDATSRVKNTDPAPPPADTASTAGTPPTETTPPSETTPAADPPAPATSTPAADPPAPDPAPVEQAPTEQAPVEQAPAPSSGPMPEPTP